MSKSPRMSISLTRPQLAFLEGEAERLGVTVAEMIRRIIDKYRETRAT